ncbi:hypothetical protein FNV43_RR02482 [Rhamnella rubrinervis]|uniref:EF-hand domain-containing protein n=1 Tax=Rhamnella rubrinervis TaxID=2594499 RepID=A0A8K0MT94_9ROSA|nr:hypothetical protein FNV43_RR02482 [Rhamnella rubrinervis]
MEEIRETAKGYYENLTEEQKSKAKEIFHSMDLNGDGSVNGNRLVFCDGHGCRAFLKGIYFTCVDCFNNKSRTFDLCSSCFNSNNYDRRKHTILLDNFTLLRCMTGSRRKVKPNSYFRLEQASRGFSYAPYYGSPKKSSTGSSENDQKITIEEAVEAFKTGAEVGELVANCCGCSIM